MKNPKSDEICKRLKKRFPVKDPLISKNNCTFIFDIIYFVIKHRIPHHIFYKYEKLFYIFLAY